MPSRKFDIIIPGNNELALTDALVVILEGFAAKRAEGVAQLCLYAAGLQRVHKTNANEDKLNSDFTKFYKERNFEKIFGSMRNFRNYASAGRVIDAHRSLGKDILKLPITSLSALNAIADMTSEETEAALEHAWQRNSQTESLDSCRNRIEKEYAAKNKNKTLRKKPVINSYATAASIKGWLQKWRHPDEPKPLAPLHRLPYITIMANANILNFNDDGSPIDRNVTIEKLEHIDGVLREALEKYETGSSDQMIIFNSKIAELRTKSEKEKQKTIEDSKKKSQKKAKK